MVARRPYVDITLTSDTPLGVFDVYRVKDYNGAEGQLTLLGPDTVRRELVVSELSPVTLFATGEVTTWDLGTYELEALVRDLVDNRLIITRYHDPRGDEAVQPFSFDLTAPYTPAQWEWHGNVKVGKVSLTVRIYSPETTVVVQ